MQFYLKGSSNDIKGLFNEEQYDAYEKAFEIDNNYLGCNVNMSEEYASTHTTEEFIDIFRECFTEEYVQDFTWIYIGEDGKLKATYSGRGADITAVFNDFSIISANENEVVLTCTIVHYHQDNPYFIWYESRNYHMVKTDDGWKFDVFQLWR